MTESQVESYLVSSIAKLGGKAWKFTSPGNAGVPDRLICFKGTAFFVELKKPGGKPRSLQKAVAKQIRQTGLRVYCISTKEQIDDLARCLDAGLLPEDSRYDRI